jgi:hypothetical protein
MESKLFILPNLTITNNSLKKTYYKKQLKIKFLNKRKLLQLLVI